MEFASGTAEPGNAPAGCGFAFRISLTLPSARNSRCELLGSTASSDVHKHHAGRIEEEVIVEGHHRIHLILEENEIAHDHQFALGMRRKRRPRGQAQERMHFAAFDSDLDVGSREIDAVHILLRCVHTLYSSHLINLASLCLRNGRDCVPRKKQRKAE